MNSSVQGKKCVVTGGTAGIGRGIAALFAKAGAEVTVVGTNPERGKEVAESIGGHFVAVDVSDKAAVDKAVEAIGEVDILINNAGITQDKLFMRMEEDDWDRVIAVNLKSVYNFSHAVIRGMVKARAGAIINVASIVGLTGNPGQANYAASKMGMIGFTKALSKEVAPRGITVNCIAPGFIETKMTEKIPEKHREALLNSIPMKRMGQPEDIASAALFLATANYITGQTLVVDGGMIA